MRHRLTVLLVVLLPALATSGCFYSRELARTRHAIEDQFPDAELDQQFVVSLGPGTLRTLSWLAHLAPREAGGTLASDYLHELRRVKVGVYEVDRLEGAGRVELGELDRLRRRGWQVVVKAHEDDEVVWILYRATRETVRDFFVLALSGDELVITRLEGRFDSLVRQVLHDFGPLDLGARPRREDGEGTSGGSSRRER